MYSKGGVKITSDQFDIRIENSGFIRLDSYIDSKTPIYFSCKLCNKKFKKKPKEFNKLKCNCVNRSNEYEKVLLSKNLTLIDTFYNVRRKLKHKCNSCNNEFESSPKTVKNSIYGCPFCSGKKISNKDYINRLPIDIEIVGEYINSYTKIEHKCSICNNNWETKPNYILHMGCGCPFCSSSKGEKEISILLNYLEIEFKSQYPIKINNNTYYYDFFIEDLNLAIEYDGIQHFEPVDYFGGVDQFKIVKENDEIKEKYSIENNIILLRIPYYEKNIEQIITHLIELILSN